MLELLAITVGGLALLGSFIGYKLDKYFKNKTRTIYLDNQQNIIDQIPEQHLYTHRANIPTIIDYNSLLNQRLRENNNIDNIPPKYEDIDLYS